MQCRDGYVNVEGIVKNNILYVANNTEQPVFAYSYEMPFSQRIELEGAKPGMRCDVDLEVDHYSYSVISANEVELRVVVDINARLMEQTDVSLITNVTETPAEDRSNEQYPSITIYFSQPSWVQSWVLKLRLPQFQTKSDRYAVTRLLCCLS